jgi:hypothetical protein
MAAHADLAAAVPGTTMRCPAPPTPGCLLLPRSWVGSFVRLFVRDSSCRVRVHFRIVTMTKTPCASSQSGIGPKQKFIRHPNASSPPSGPILQKILVRPDSSAFVPSITCRRSTLFSPSAFYLSFRHGTIRRRMDLPRPRVPGIVGDPGAAAPSELGISDLDCLVILVVVERLLILVGFPSRRGTLCASHGKNIGTRRSSR